MRADYEVGISFHLRLLRCIKGVNLFEVCRETRIPFRTLYRAERGYCKHLRLTDVALLAKYYAVPIPNLFRDAKKDAEYLLGILLEGRLKQAVR